EGDPNAGLYLLVSGRAKISRMSLDGREQVLAPLRPGDSCNEVPVIDDGPNPASLTTIEDSVFWIWSGAEMKRLRVELPGLTEAITNSLAGRCRELVDKVYRLSFLSVAARLAHFLIEQASQQQNQDLDRRRWTQEEIAANIGTVREMVGRSFRSLENDGLIRVNRHRIEILDRAAMEKVT
ncbi:MAG: Crp/Fnr family transcriptional regulator, partial [Anaerolineales bacterium]|nr:Crp/Fnr family transcriptional regulator [Anaerolineales bacterium]